MAIFRTLRFGLLFALLCAAAASCISPPDYPDTPRIKFSVEGGPGFVNENFQSAPDDSYTALREAARLDVLLTGRRVVLFHAHDGYFGVTGDDNLFMKMQNGIRLALVGGFVTTAQMDLDYDRSPAPGRRNSDRTFALTFGYRF